MKYLIKSEIFLITSMAIFLISFFPFYFIFNPDELPLDIPIFIGLSMFSSIIFTFPIWYVYIRSFKKHFFSLILISSYAVIIENIAILTGFPYSKFVYSNLMGPKFLFAPITLPFSWVPIFILALVIVHKIKNKLHKIILGGLLMTYFDLVLDPGATNIGFWIWETKTGFYNVPYVNFLGWIFTSITMFILWEFIYPKFAPKIKDQKYLLLSGIYILAFFMGINFWLGQYIPVILGLILWLYIYKRFFMIKNNL